jgi:hypothetical protein
MDKKKEESFSKKIRTWREENVLPREEWGSEDFDALRLRDEEKALSRLRDIEGVGPHTICGNTRYYVRLGTLNMNLASKRLKRKAGWAYKETSQYFPPSIVCDTCHPAAEKAKEEGRVVMGSSLVRYPFAPRGGVIQRIGRYVLWFDRPPMAKRADWRQAYLKGMRNGEIRYSYKTDS